MIKIWPIHKHEWKYLSTSEHTWRNNSGAVTSKQYNFLLICRCTKSKTVILKDHILDSADTEAYIKAKGWA